MRRGAWVAARARFVFLNERVKSLGSERMTLLLKRHWIAAVPLGFRSRFWDWSAEETDHPREVVEAARAHVVKSKVEAEYRRMDLFERRRQLMHDWAAYLGSALENGHRRRGIRLAGRPLSHNVSGWSECAFGCAPVALAICARPETVPRVLHGLTTTTGPI